MKKSSLVIMCIFLLVIGNSACSNKKIERSGKSKSEKNTVMETAPYDDENEPVTVLEQDIVNTEFHEISGGGISILYKDWIIHERQLEGFFYPQKRADNWKWNGSKHVCSADEIWSSCNDGTDRKGFRVKDEEVLYEFYDDGTPVKLDMFIWILL